MSGSTETILASLNTHGGRDAGGRPYDVEAGYAPAVTGRTHPAHRPLVQLDHILAGRGVARCGGEVLPRAGPDHLPVRARLRVK